jgi:hypothetical protein
MCRKSYYVVINIETVVIIGHKNLKYINKLKQGGLTLIKKD